MEQQPTVATISLEEKIQKVIEAYTRLKQQYKDLTMQKNELTNNFDNLRITCAQQEEEIRSLNEKLSYRIEEISILTNQKTELETTNTDLKEKLNYNQSKTQSAASRIDDLLSLISDEQ